MKANLRRSWPFLVGVNDPTVNPDGWYMCKKYVQAADHVLTLLEKTSGSRWLFRLANLQQLLEKGFMGSELKSLRFFHVDRMNKSKTDLKIDTGICYA